MGRGRPRALGGRVRRGASDPRRRPRLPRGGAGGAARGRVRRPVADRHPGRGDRDVVGLHQRRPLRRRAAMVDADVEALALTANTVGAAIEREITGRELQEAQARYRTLIEQIPAVTYIEDVDNGDEIFSSPQTQRLLGYGPDEWGLSHQWAAALHPDDRERALAANDAADEAGGPFTASTGFCTRTGTGVGARRGRPGARRRRRAALLAGRALRHHRREGVGAAASPGGGALPGDRRAHARRDLPRSPRRRHGDDLHQPADRGDRGRHAGALDGRPRDLARPHGPRRARSAPRVVSRVDPRATALARRVPDPPARRQDGLDPRRDDLPARRRGQTRVAAGRAVRHHRAQARRAGAPGDRAARARRRRAAARARRDEEHLPGRGLARAAEPAHLDPGPGAHAGAHARLPETDRTICWRVWRPTRGSSTSCSRTCSTSTDCTAESWSPSTAPPTSPRSRAGPSSISTHSPAARSS